MNNSPIDGFRHWRTPEEAHHFAQRAAVLSGVMSRAAQNIATTLQSDIRRHVKLAHKLKQLDRNLSKTLLDIARQETLDHNTERSLYLMDDVADEVERAGRTVANEMKAILLAYYQEWGARQPELMAHAATALYLIAALNTTIYVVAADLSPTLDFRKKLTERFQSATTRIYNSTRLLVEQVELSQHYTSPPTFRFMCDVKQYDLPQGADGSIGRLIHQYATDLLEAFHVAITRKSEEIDSEELA